MTSPCPWAAERGTEFRYSVRIRRRAFQCVGAVHVGPNRTRKPSGEAYRVGRTSSLPESVCTSRSGWRGWSLQPRFGPSPSSRRARSPTLLARRSHSTAGFSLGRRGFSKLPVFDVKEGVPNQGRHRVEGGVDPPGVKRFEKRPALWCPGAPDRHGPSPGSSGRPPSPGATRIPRRGEPGKPPRTRRTRPFPPWPGAGCTRGARHTGRCPESEGSDSALPPTGRWPPGPSERTIETGARRCGLPRNPRTASRRRSARKALGQALQPPAPRARRRWRLPRGTLGLPSCRGRRRLVLLGQP